MVRLTTKNLMIFLEQGLTKLQNSTSEEVKSENGESSFLKMKMDKLRRGYRLSFGDGHYRDYQNEYSTNDLAKPFKQRCKERDKKKYLSARFALADDYEFVVCFACIFSITILVGCSKRP